MPKKLELWPIEKLRPYESNSRTHSSTQIDKVMASMIEYGFTNPILVDSKAGIIAGHGRLEAAKKLRLTEVPVVVLDHLSDEQKRAYVIADNKLAELAGWDNAILSSELKDLKDLDYNLDLLGFSDEELKDLLPEEFEENENDADQVPDSPYADKVSLGDIFILGTHRLMCGDSTDKDTIEKLMNGEKADMVFTDPPYGISIVKKDSTVCGDGGMAKPGKYKQILGDNKPFDPAFVLSLDIETTILWGANHYASRLPDSAQWLIWDKKLESGSMDSNDYSDCELAWTNRKGLVAKIYRHIWTGMVREGSRHEELKDRVHPTQKPVGLCAQVITDFSKEEETVLDLFGGSGSTLIACEKTSRKCFMMELDPHYISVVLDRWEKYSNKKAIRESDNQLWSEIKG